MIKSMTGYGKASAALPAGVVTVEIRSLNSKFLDLNMRLPRLLQDKEYAIRNLLNGPLERGKITVNIQIDSSGAERESLINASLFKAYYRELHTLCAELQLSEQGLAESILRIPEVAAGEGVAEISWWSDLELLIKSALDQFNHFREEEGRKTGDDMLQSVARIEADLAAVAPYESIRIENIKNRIKAGLELFVEQEKIDLNRLEQELVFYLEKLDVSEEKQRLAQHCAYFRQNLKQASGGKKLGFIAQEMGREINTLGSKCNQIDIQKLVVNMKNELEKIKEQVLNVL